MTARRMIDLTKDESKTLLVCVITPSNHMAPEYYEEEFLSLASTLGIEYEDIVTMRLRSTDNNMFLTKGKLEELLALATSMGITKAYFSESLSPLQERNLENALGFPVYDRAKLILEIFSKSAHTAEGKIQVEMAEFEYLRTRIIGRGKELAQQAGLIGTRGPGETEKEELKRYFQEKMRIAKRRLETLERARETQRKQRLNRKIPLLCIIGYTNAGKSSLINMIAKGNVLAEDKLFATLDTTTRELIIDARKVALISDTVGFISQLPHQLIAAFKSTLDELRYAHMLIHVIDISNPAWRDQVEVVHQTLKELQINAPMVYVFNKIDKLSQLEMQLVQSESQAYNPHVIIHTQSKEGVAPLVDFLRNHFASSQEHVLR